jgi:hypothetical protein
MYFLCLGELGYPGIFFLLSLIVTNIVSNSKRIRLLKIFDSKIAVSYQRLFICLNASILGWSVAGAFLSALYYPHLFVLSGISVSSELNLIKDIPEYLDIKEKMSKNF